MSEKSFFFGLINLGYGDQAINYFILCFGAILGVLQFVAARYNRRDLIWFDGTPGYGIGIALTVGSFVWFFLTDQEIFIPALAGGEFFSFFTLALVCAVPTTRVIAFALARAFVPATKSAREKEPTV
ncbi:MAG: hypothetical protein HZC40_14310 [Chloroflexi bacterium]|nr:hypothetical protein [Chloroflexota bacterium]